MLALLLAFVALLQAVSAQFHLSTDKSSYSAGDTMVVSWSTSGSTLKLSDLKQGTLDLCTCNSTGDFSCQDIKTKVDLTQSSISVPVASFAALGPSGSYTIQLVAIDPTNKGEYAISYLQSFVDITGMTGSGTADSSCQVPTDDSQNVPGTGTASSSTISWTSYTLPSQYQTVSSYLIPYTWQKGATRVAPYQSTPGTRVTVTTTPSRRYPTSAYTPFSTYFFNKWMPVTTLTPSPAKPAVQHENFVSALHTTPSGYQPTQILPSLGITTRANSTRARKRWID